MNAYASPLITEFPDVASLGAILDILEGHADKVLVLAYGDGQQVQAGYHITEVKAGSFVTLDCGGNPDAWRETVLQVEDIPPDRRQHADDRRQVPVNLGKGRQQGPA
jgi:hypothetical protein